MLEEKKINNAIINTQKNFKLNKEKFAAETILTFLEEDYRTIDNLSVCSLKSKKELILIMEKIITIVINMKISFNIEK